MTRAEFDAAQAARSVLVDSEGCAGLAGAAERVGALCGLWPHAEDHRQLPALGSVGVCRTTTATAATRRASARPGQRSSPPSSTRTSRRLVLDALRTEGGPLAQAVAASEQLEAARRAVEEAEHELALYLEADLISVVGQETFRRGVEARQRTRRHGARRHLPSSNSKASWRTNCSPETCSRPGRHSPSKRSACCCTGCSTASWSPARSGRGKNAPPIEDRVTIVLRGGVPLEPDADQLAEGSGSRSSDSRSSGSRVHRESRRPRCGAIRPAHDRNRARHRSDQGHASTEPRSRHGQTPHPT